MAPARIQVATFSGDRCREIEAALIISGYLPGKASKLQLQYPHGGSWHVTTGTERAVIAVSARPAGNSQWVLEVQPSAPLRPHVVYRRPPSESQMKQFEQMCYDVALVIHDTLCPLCPDLQWKLEMAGRTLTSSAAPIPPAT